MRSHHANSDRLLLLLLPLLAACGGGSEPVHGGNGPADPCTLQACPRTCANDEGCGSGQRCVASICENVAPTSNAYTRCYLDTDCPAGDHCSVGVCAHDCASDGDCAGDLVCSARGRCTEPDRLGDPPPVETPAGARLVVAPSRVDLGPASDEGAVTVRNDGDGPLEVRAIASHEWLTATPAAAEIAPGEAAVFSMHIDRGGATADAAAVSFTSNAGVAHVPVALSRRLDGRFHGRLAIREPADLGLRELAFEVAEDEEGNVTGVLVPALTPTLPVATAVAGSRDEAGAVLAFEVVAEPGSAANPTYPLPVRHRIALDVEFAGASELTGTFTWTVEGVLPDRVLSFGGSASLRRAGPSAGLVPVEQPAFVAVEPSEPAWPTCPTCPPGATCPGDPDGDRVEMLRAAFPFYAGFYGGRYHLIEKDCRAGTANCFNPNHALCAMKDAWQRDNQSHLHDVVTGLSPHWTLSGSHMAVTALSRGAQSDLITEAGDYGLAVNRASMALHRRSSFQPAIPSPLDPWLLARLFDNPLVGQSRTSIFPEPGANDVLPRQDLVRVAQAQRVQLFAVLARQQLLHRLGRFDDALQETAQTLPAAALDLGILAELFAAHGGGGASDVFVESRSYLAQLADLHADLREGRNPAGQDEELVPFLLRSTEMRTNFEAVLDVARQKVMRLRDAEVELEGRNLAYEQESAALRAELADLKLSLRGELEQLCGANVRIAGGVLERCDSGEAQDLRFEVEKATRQVRAAGNDIDGLWKRIEVEEGRLARMLDIGAGLVEMTLKNGDRRRILARRSANVEQVSNAFGLAGTVASVLAGPMKWGEVVGDLITGGGAVITTELRANIEKDRLELETMEQVTIREAEGEREAEESAARIKTWLIDLPNLTIQMDLAQIAALQAAARLGGIYERAQFLVDRMEERKADLADHYLRDPSDRLFLDAELALFQKAASDARRWSFLAGRALEYELNVALVSRHEPFQVHGASQLDLFLDALEEQFLEDWSEPQPTAEVVSFRRHILGIDGATVEPESGETIDARERFRRYVLAPENWDADGNLRLTFSTAPNLGRPLFSANVFNDRIVSLKVNLVGDHLGDRNAFVALEQAGLNLVRDAGGAFRAYRLGDLRTVIQAGINADVIRDDTIPAGIEFLGRSVHAESWTLVLVTNGTEPSNADLDLSTLQDVEILFNHGAVTIQ